MKDTFFTIITYVDHEDLLENYIKSVVECPKDIREMIKLVIVDPFGTEVLKDISEYYKEKYKSSMRIKYIPIPGCSLSEAYNTAISEIRGKYVNFSLTSIGIERGTMECVHEVCIELDNPKMISLSPWTINEKDEKVPYLLAPVVKEKGYEVINLHKEPGRVQLLLHAYFIRSYIVKGDENPRRFIEGIAQDVIVEFLLRIMSEYQYYVLLSRVGIKYTEQLEDNTSAFRAQYLKEWYMESFENWIIPFAKECREKRGGLNKAVQISLLWFIYSRYFCNYNDRNKAVLDKEEFDELNLLAGEALSYIDNSVIWTQSPNQTYKIVRTLRLFFLNLKSKYINQKGEVVQYGNQINYWSCEEDNSKSEGFEFGYYKNILAVSRKEGEVVKVEDIGNKDNFIKLASIQTEHVLLKAINFKNGQLEIDGTFSMGDFLAKDKISLKVLRNKQIINADYSEIYGLNKVFGVVYNHMYQFHVDIPVFSIKDVIDIQFICTMNGEDYVLEIKTPKVHAHVRAGIKNQYWRFCDEWCASLPDKTHMVLQRLNESKMAAKEVLYQKELAARAAKGSKAASVALELRKLYFEQKKQLCKPVWITHDKLYKAGDNGEYMYHYINENCQDIDIYYIIKSDSVDYERMNVEGAKLLIWGEIDTMVKVLLSEVILSTHTDVLSYAGFSADVVPYICDLYNPVNVCIQHGLTTQNIAQYQNRIFDNIHFYTCASPNEIDNLSKPIYGYTDKTVLALTGLARYDGLKNNDKKQILITPTWRRNIANAGVAHIKKGHNEYFKNSEYFKIYNSLINDEKLIKCAKKNRYKLIYLLH